MRWSASRYPHINTSLPIPLTLMRRDPLPPSPPLCVNNLVLNTDYKRKHIEANQFYYTKYFLKHLKWRGYIYNMPRLRLAGRKGEGGDPSWLLEFVAPGQSQGSIFPTVILLIPLSSSLVLVFSSIAKITRIPSAIAYRIRA